MRQNAATPALANVQILRALAALAVVCVHLYEQSAKYDQPLALLSLFRNWGDCGVDLFFVISGFIMVYVQRHRPSPPAAFLGHRLYRVVPLYWALSLSYLALFVAWPQLFGAAEIDATRIGQSLSFTTFLFPDAYPILYLGWTLEYEMFFYIMFSLALVARRLEWAVVVAASLILTGFLALRLDAVVFEFAFGCVLGLVYDRPWIRRHAVALLVAGTILLAATMIDTAFAFDHRALMWGVPATLIVAGAVNVRQVGNPTLRFFGDASYSIYLIQVFTISAFYKATTAMAFDLPNDVEALLCLALTAAGGCVLYLAVEKPLIDLRRRNFDILRGAARRWLVLGSGNLRVRP